MGSFGFHVANKMTPNDFNYLNDQFFTAKSKVFSNGGTFSKYSGVRFCPGTVENVLFSTFAA